MKELKRSQLIKNVIEYEIKESIRQDTLELIGRVDLAGIRSELKKLGFEVYSKLKKSKATDILLRILKSSSLDVVLDFYYDNKVRLGMSKKEILKVLDINESEFDKISKDLKMIGEIEVPLYDGISNRIITVKKYDREYVYNYKFNIMK